MSTVSTSTKLLAKSVEKVHRINKYEAAGAVYRVGPAQGADMKLKRCCRARGAGLNVKINSWGIYLKAFSLEKLSCRAQGTDDVFIRSSILLA